MSEPTVKESVAEATVDKSVEAAADEAAKEEENSPSGAEETTEKESTEETTETASEGGGADAEAEAESEERAGSTEETKSEAAESTEGEEESGDLPFVDVTKPNPGRIPLTAVQLESFYTTPDRNAIAGAVEDLNEFPLKSSGTVPIALSFAPAPASAPAPALVYYAPPPAGVFSNTAPDDPPGPQEYIDDAPAPNKGYRLFSDVFSRADKNDDGGLTFEEFRSYFDDGHVTDEELLALFNDVDADNNGNISLLELDSYFREGFEPYSRMFSVLAKMHSAITGGLGHSYRGYPQQNAVEQFKTRFYLREFVTQLQALHSPVSSALEILERATEVHKDTAADDSGAEEDFSTSGDRVAPRKVRNAALAEYAAAGALDAQQSTDPGQDVLAELREQVSRLSHAVEEIHSSKANLRWVQQDVFGEHAPTESSFIIACRQADVTPELVYVFRDACRSYVAATQAEEGCRHVYLKQHANETKYAIYEIYESEDALAEHNTSVPFRRFQKDIIDSLEEPLASTLMEMPTSWWCSA
mmetsp:Transcript_10953/g.44813  ORF Transcript_10953/g.44813 Transcript_10953/m.44813 type:complete len:529 (+) Transcript_10953:122-1708(+)